MKMRIRKYRDFLFLRRLIPERTLNFIQNYYDKKRVKIRIDYWDIWNLDITLASIIYEGLCVFKKQKCSGACVDDEDLSDSLGDLSQNDEKRWDYILDEMIFAFKHLKDYEWESQFYSGETDLKFVKIKEENGYTYSRLEKGPGHTFKFDTEGYMEVKNKVDNGLRLFSKYFTDLWD
jgi:hypothetical protein